MEIALQGPVTHIAIFLFPLAWGIASGVLLILSIYLYFYLEHLSRRIRLFFGSRPGGSEHIRKLLKHSSEKSAGQAISGHLETLGTQVIESIFNKDPNNFHLNIGKFTTFADNSVDALATGRTSEETWKLLFDPIRHLMSKQLSWERSIPAHLSSGDRSDRLRSFTQTLEKTGASALAGMALGEPGKGPTEELSVSHRPFGVVKNLAMSRSPVPIVFPTNWQALCVLDWFGGGPQQIH